MKILRLEVCNLASLAANPEHPHVVDFTISPLKDAGLLAITGSTGAGKSTLLDAMCLALFNEVPRLRTAHLGQDGRLSDAKDQLSFGDKRTVLSRGAVEGFARVEFQGLDGGRYRAEWRVKRAYLKADGALQAVERSLRDLDHNVVLASKTKDCAERIEQLIGMNFDQFTRAVLLAQSEFSTFLKANDSERAALLECLTDSGIYTELGKLAFQKAKTAREAKQQLEAQHGLVTPLSLEARQQLEQQLSQHAQTCSTLTQQLEQLNQQQRWYQQQAELTTQRDHARDTQSAADASWQAAAPQRQRLEQRQALTAVRHDYVKAKSLQTEIANLKLRLSATQQQLEQAEQTLKQAEYSQKQAEQAEQAWQAQRNQLKPIVAKAERDSIQLQHEQQEQLVQKQQFEQAQHTQKQQIAQQNTQQQQLVQQQQTQQQLAQQLIESQSWQCLDGLSLATLLDALHSASIQHDSYQQQQQQCVALQPEQQATQQQVDHAQHCLQQHISQYADDPVLRQRLLDLAEQTTKLPADIQQLQQLQHGQQQSQQFEQQIATQQAKYQQLQQQHAEQQQHVIQLERDTEHSRIAQQTQSQHLQRQRMIQQHSVVELRTTLQPMQPCPVCGSHEHPYAGDLVDSAALSLAEQLLEDNEQQLQALTEQCQHKQQQLTQQQLALRLTEQQISLTQQLEQDLSAQRLAQQQMLLPQQQQLSATYSLTQLADLDQLLVQQQHCIVQLEQQHAQIFKWQDERLQLRTQVEQAKQQLEQVSTQTSQLLQTLQQTEQQYVRATQQFLPALPPELQQTWQQAAAAPTGLTTLAEQWQHSLQQRRQQLEAQHAGSLQLAKTQQQLDAQQPFIQQQQQQLEQQRRQLQQRQSSIEQLQQQIQQVLPVGLSNVPAWQQQLEQQSHQYQQQQQLAEQALRQAQQQQQLLQRELALQQQALNQQKQERDACTARVLACRERYLPAASNDVLAELMAISDAELQQMQQQLQQQQRALDQATVRLEQLQQQMAIHQQQQPTANQIQILTDIQQQHTALQQAQEQRATSLHLLREDDARRKRDQVLAQQIAQAEIEHQRWAKLAAPIGCATGATFRKIAQGYQLDSLLFYANQQLQLFSPRYQLQRAPNSLGLLVVDADLANERRAVHSLSGGESFLVSLALALALAQMASGQMQIESLFIDEGFGSLDPESLQVVMDALDQLQGQGRKVAVITHVQEMQERIPVQIRVERRGSGCSVLRVMG